ncbi:MAG TPA: phosphoenolpyruvate--protein phosphotransferase, partial [Spirochaetia bacterium]|nr:phosphoenolpyruvate--protein phosphotransferase [Spirochaetia bacterium]
GDEEKKLLDSHILMLSDPEFKLNIENKVEEKRVNVEWILLQVIEDLIKRINESSDEYIRARSLDIHDVSRRVMRHLLLHERMSLTDLPGEVIVVAHNLLPSDAIGMDKKMVKGIAVDLGSKTSHTAIIARSFNIPAVMGLSDLSQQVDNGMEIVIDGNRGVVIVDPDKEIKSFYHSNLIKWHKHEKKLQDLKKMPAVTTDGLKVTLGANIEVAEDVDSVIEHGADGIGLFRSEFLFMRPNSMPSEDEQFRTYKYVLEGMKGKPVTIRTLDLGGEKMVPGLEIGSEDNPILGWRAVRYCLAKPEVFKAQLRAMYRASVFGNLKIMFPMISGIEELLRTLDIVDQVKFELKKEKVDFRKDIPVGAMIEVPSAALTSEILAKKVDFFSIGTNDLIQYTIAVDRSNEKIAYLYEPFHPGVLKLIKMIVENAHAAGIPVSMCGEMAGDLSATVVLLGMKLDELSMSPFTIPEIKNIIRNISQKEAEGVVQAISKMSFSQEIDEYVKNWMEDRLAVVSY